MSDDNIDWHLMFGRAQHKVQPKRRSRRKLTHDDEDEILNLFETGKYLRLSAYQMLQVVRHQDFPTRSCEFGWLKGDIKKFRRKMERARRDGLKVPDIFFGPRRPEPEPL